MAEIVTSGAWRPPSEQAGIRGNVNEARKVPGHAPVCCSVEFSAHIA